MSAGAALPPQRHPRLARFLHWTMALLLPVQALLGWYGDRLDDRHQSLRVLGWHVGLGVLLAALLVMRLLRRLGGRAPAPPAGAGPAWRAALAVHTAIYLLLLVLPASGYVIWIWMGAPRDVLGLFELPRLFVPPADDETGRAVAWYLHVYGAWLLGALVALHVAAVAWHERLRGERVLARMWGSARRDQGSKPSAKTAAGGPATGTRTAGKLR